MKQPLLFIAMAIAICCTLISAISLTSREAKSKIKFNYEIKFNCTINFRDQFSGNNMSQSQVEERTEFKASGYCESKNFNRFNIEMSHVNYVIETGDIARIGQGIFKMKGDDGDQLFGTYEGCADLTNNPQDMILFLTITGGAGYYEGATGYFRAICSPDGTDPHLRKLKLKGTIKREGNNLVS